MTRAMGACSMLAWNLFTTVLLVDGWRTGHPLEMLEPI